MKKIALAACAAFFVSGVQANPFAPDPDTCTTIDDIREIVEPDGAILSETEIKGSLTFSKVFIGINGNGLILAALAYDECVVSRPAVLAQITPSVDA